MDNVLSNKKTSGILFVIIYISINLFFTLKYTERISINPFFTSLLYVIFVVLCVICIKKYHLRLSDKVYKWLFKILVGVLVAVIIFLLIKIDPYSIRVDRWSALTYFWDSLFDGIYPYGTHTHVAETNFPSPFPFWHLIALPFYLLGDVGIEIIVFFILVSVAVKVFFQSYKKAFFFVLLLVLSPGYWWEICARSDSLSNAFLVFMIILWYIKAKRSLSDNLISTTIIVGLIAATRFTALIPVALFFFPQFLKLSNKKKLIFLFGVSAVAFLFFAPFIFWDTETWVFFRRNPFMSQTGNGSLYVLLASVVLGIVLAVSWKGYGRFFLFTAFFIFIFIGSNQLYEYFTLYYDGTFFGFADISYYNLALPYCLLGITLYLSNPIKYKVYE